jgi:hypothetical protein
MPSPSAANHRSAQITIIATYGHAPERAVEYLATLLSRFMNEEAGTVLPTIPAMTKENPADGDDNQSYYPTG